MVSGNCLCCNLVPVRSVFSETWRLSLHFFTMALTRIPSSHATERLPPHRLGGFSSSPHPSPCELHPCPNLICRCFHPEEKPDSYSPSYSVLNVNSTPRVLPSNVHLPSPLDFKFLRWHFACFPPLKQPLVIHSVGTQHQWISEDEAVHLRSFSFQQHHSQTPWWFSLQNWSYCNNA